MAIKIFFKHLFTSIRKRPAQPVLLIIIVAVAVMVSILALQLNAMITEEQEALFEACNGNSNIVISVSPGDNRFLNPQIAEKLLGDEADVCGIYTLPFYDENDKLVKGVHTDLDSVGNVFEELDFEEVKSLQGGAMARSIVISPSFAESHNLAVGDDVTLSLLGIKKDYKVRAIASGDIMGEYAVMVDAQAT